MKKRWEKGRGVKVTGSKVCNCGTRGGVECPDSSRCSVDRTEVSVDLVLPRGTVGNWKRNGSLSLQYCPSLPSSSWWLGNLPWLGPGGSYEVVLVSWWASEREDLTKKRKGGLGRQLLLEAGSKTWGSLRLTQDSCSWPLHHCVYIGITWTVGLSIQWWGTFRKVKKQLRKFVKKKTKNQGNVGL